MKCAKSDCSLADKATGKIPVRRAGVLLWRALMAKSEAPDRRDVAWLRAKSEAATF